MRKTIRHEELPGHRPDDFLTVHSQGSPDFGLFSTVNEFLKAEILSARSKLRLAEPELVALDLAPSSFGDFPLNELLAEGRVIGMDVNKPAMESARAGLSSPEQERLTLLHVDASLAANEIIESVRQSTEPFPSLTEESFQQIRRGLRGLELDRCLPFADHSIDLAVAVSAFTSFMIGAVNASITGYLWNKYGESPSFRFLSEKMEHQGREVARGQLLVEEHNDLYHRMVRLLLREMERVVKPGGLVFISDHALITQQFRYGGEFDLRPEEEAFPPARFLSDLKVEPEGERINFTVAERMEGVRVRGKDSLAAIVARAASFEILDEFCFGNVNCLGNILWQLPATYQLDTGLLLRPR